MKGLVQNCANLEAQLQQSNICGSHSLLHAASGGNQSEKRLNQPTKDNNQPERRKGISEMTVCYHKKKPFSCFFFFSSGEKVCGTKEAFAFYRSY